MVLLFNNCHCREHSRMYGRGAFYDLNVTGYQSTKATDLTVGQECIVARTQDSRIVFDWYAFQREEILPDDTNTQCRVLIGNFIKSEVYSKIEATRIAPYSAFFDVNGNFKRHSVIELRSAKVHKTRPSTNVVRVLRGGLRHDWWLGQTSRDENPKVSAQQLGDWRRELIRLLNIIDPRRDQPNEKVSHNASADCSVRV